MALGTMTEHRSSEVPALGPQTDFQSFLNLMPDAIVISNEAGRILLVNTEVERLFGFPREKLLSQPVETLMPERFRAQHVGHRKAYCENPRTRPMGVGFELLGLREDNKEFPVEISLSALRTQDGLIICSAIRDITERKLFEATLKQTAAELARSNSELEQFAHAASHDLQEPLRTVVGAIQVLAEDHSERLSPDASQWLGFARDAAKRMQLLLNALLDYARFGGQRKPFELVNCLAIYQAAVTSLKAAIEDSAAELTNDPLPTVIGDSGQLMQLFQNLLANAIKFKAQGRAPRIHVSVEQQDREWRVAIRDNGIGIDPKHFARIFVLFSRLHTPRQYPGTGIGLAISKKIVERHGGRIWVESAPGEGATFNFTIPVAKT
jgi:PAS domain S-box-containing protein